MTAYAIMIETPEERSRFEQIYLQYKGLMFHAANQILHNPQDAEDAVHQAFVKIAENIGKIERPICPRTQSYVVTITENQAIDRYRARQRSHDIEYIDEIESLVTPPPEITTVADCILKLPPRYRHVILLKYSQGFTTEEVARMLDITPANASKLDQRAKKRLLEICREEGVL